MGERTLNHHFADVTAELDRRVRISLGFERIEALLAALGDPERELEVVQVVGTNGKGTTSVALSAALEEAGETTGTYLSPHVISYSERVRVRGEQVSREAFAGGMGSVIETADAGGIEVTQFELLTAGAVAMFRDAGVRWAVMEAGLGARYDATTAARPGTVVLTNVSLDHTAYLGETIGEIATEKLASVPKGGTLVLGSEDPVVAGLAREVCKKRGARLVEIPHSPAPEGLAESLVEDSRLAPYALSDVFLGFRAAETLLGRNLGEAVLRKTLLRARGALPARFEVREVGGVPVIVDGGHNPAGVRAALGAVRDIYPDRDLGVVFGVLRDKDIRSMLGVLEQGEVQSLALTRPESERAAEPYWISTEYGPRDGDGRPAAVEPEAGPALESLVEEMRGRGGVVLVTGSLATGAVALRWMEKRRKGGLDEGQ